MATRARKGLTGSIDDIREDLRRYDVEPRVPSARASQPAGSSGGRAWSSSVQASKKLFAEDDFFSKAPGENKAAAGDKDDTDWDFLGTSKPSSGAQKMPVKRGTESSSETTSEQSSREELPPRQTPPRTVAPVQRRKKSTFKDGDNDDLLDALRRGKGQKKEEEFKSAWSKLLDKLFRRGSAAKYRRGSAAEVLEKPEKEKPQDKEELVFGTYKPSMGSRPAVRMAMGQLPRSSDESSESEPNSEPHSTAHLPGRRNPVQRRRGGDDWLGLKDDDFLDPQSPAKGSPALSIPSLATAGQPSPTSQLGAAEEAAAKPDPMDWLTAALAHRKAEEQTEVQEIKAMETQEKKFKASETQEKVTKPSETEEKVAKPSEAQEKMADLSEAQETKAEPSETAGEGPGPRSPVSQLAASPAASKCQAELLSAQARVAELESQVRLLEEERAHHKLLLENAQRQHQQFLDFQKSSHRTSANLLEENYRQQVEMLQHQNEQLVAQLRQQWQDTAQDRAELLEQHRLDLEQLREQHRLELQWLRELQRECIQELRKKHEEQLQHVKWLKEQEMDVVTSFTSHTRSLDSIIEKMEKFSSDLQNVSKRSMEEERSCVQDLVANTEARLGEQTRLLEQERAELKIQGQELKAKEEQLARDRQRLGEAWQKLRLEKEKVIGAAQRVQQQEELMRTANKLLAEKRAEGERAQEEARRMESEFRDRLQVLQEQQEHLKQQHQCLHQEKASLASMYNAQVQLLQFQAQREDKYLEREKFFLESLKKAQ